jgi:hypothetical protein
MSADYGALAVDLFSGRNRVVCIARLMTGMRDLIRSQWEETGSGAGSIRNPARVGGRPWIERAAGR